LDIVVYNILILLRIRIPEAIIHLVSLEPPHTLGCVLGVSQKNTTKYVSKIRKD